MENRVIDDATLREYLLGHLENDQELVERIDERIITDPEFSLNLDIIEDEIIEEYLEGSLSAAQVQAVERHFLRPPERQHKLRNARLLSSHLAEAVPDLKKADRAPTGGFNWPSSRVLTPRSWRTWTEIAASILFAVSISYLWNEQRKLEIAVRQGNLQVSQERERSADLGRQLQALLPLAQSSTVMLNLVSPGLLRGDATLPEVKIGTTTKTVQVKIAVTSSSSQPYTIRLEHADTTLWTLGNINATAVTGGAVLKMDIPAAILPQGISSLRVKQLGRGDLLYWLRVSKRL